MNKLKWVKSTCPVCGKEYEHLETYKPPTCSQFECIHSFLHDPKYRKAKEAHEKEARK